MCCERTALPRWWHARRAPENGRSANLQLGRDIGIGAVRAPAEIAHLFIFFVAYTMPCWRSLTGLQRVKTYYKITPSLYKQPRARCTTDIISHTKNALIHQSIPAHHTPSTNMKRDIHFREMYHYISGSEGLLFLAVVAEAMCSMSAKIKQGAQYAS
jgi:hypothetical protein